MLFIWKTVIQWVQKGVTAVFSKPPKPPVKILPNAEALTLAKLLTSNPLDFNCEKINGNINQLVLQPTFFPGYIQNLSGYSRLKLLAVTGKKMLVVPEDFFHG